MSLTKLPFSRKLLSLGPIILLYISVLNEFDFNYLNLKYFSFNFPYILIFYWSLKGEGRLSYVLVFFAGLINDVVIGLPLGISSVTYLFICVFTMFYLLLICLSFYVLFIIFYLFLYVCIILFFFILFMILSFICNFYMFCYFFYLLCNCLFAIYSKGNNLG